MIVAGGLVSPLVAAAKVPDQGISAEVGALSSLAMSAFAASTPVARGAAAPATGAVLTAATRGSRPAEVPPAPEPGDSDGSPMIVAAGASAPRVGQSVVNPSSAAPRRAGDRVIIRKPSRDYGSGFLGDYGKLRRLTAPPATMRAAAVSDNGCLIIGDSIASMSKEAVILKLRRSHSAVCAWDTWSGRPTEGTANALADYRASYGLPSTVIVMSGSNDIFNPPLFAAQARRVLAIAGPQTRVIWVNVFARRNAAKRFAADLRNSAGINKTLAAVAAPYSNVQLIDWYSFVTKRTRKDATFLLDGIHPNAAGQRALADLVGKVW